MAPLAVVTGASRGIGRRLTERLTEAGTTVAAVARRREDLAEVAGRTGAVPFALDVADPAAVRDGFARILDELGAPDLLVNNAGVYGDPGLSWEVPDADWWQVFEVNVRGTYLCSRAVLPAMAARGSGRIVTMSSGLAGSPLVHPYDAALSSAYLASKAAVNRFTEVLAAEAEPAGIGVFALSPGRVRTDMTAAAFPELWEDDSGWTPADRCADLVLDLHAGLLDGLTGRYLRAAVDDWRKLGARAAQVVGEDTHIQRLVFPGG